MKSPPPDLVLYHWSPTSRRKSILRYGFKPRSHSLDKEWRPPYTCFANNALLAWNLSGRLHQEIKEWDLWAVFRDDLPVVESIIERFYDSGRMYVKEYRTYERIFKRHVHYVASRTVD